MWKQCEENISAKSAMLDLDGKRINAAVKSPQCCFSVQQKDLLELELIK